MKITKFEHACFAVEQNGESLVVDPGNFTTDFVVPDNVVSVVITHEHGDHLDKDLLKKIIEKNSNAVIVAHPDIIAQLGEFKTKAVNVNDKTKVGAFELEFFGGQHATIAKGFPVIANLGVLINGRLYYPGDSFTIPDQPVEILALPIGAPWLRIDEVIDFLAAIKPKLAFPTHDAVLSDIGKSLPDRLLPSIAEKVGGSYRRIDDSPLEA